MRMQSGEDFLIMYFIVCSFHLIYSGRLNLEDVARMEDGRSPFIILTGKPKGKSPLRKPRRN